MREVVYRLRDDGGPAPTQLPFLLSRAAPGATIETTVAHLDDEGNVWRTLAVHGAVADVKAVAAAFARYKPAFLAEKAVLGRSPRRLILWYKYRPERVPGTSHTRLAFRLLGRDTIITDRAQSGTLTTRILARPGPRLRDFLRLVRKAGQPQGFELLYSGPPREADVTRLSPVEEETLRAAQRMGHYAAPRRADVRAVARALGVSPSAVSYRLRAAEAKLIAAYLER
jgi:hypothetical protein